MCAQCLYCTTPRACGSKFRISAAAQNAINLWAEWELHSGGCAMLPFPSLSNSSRSAAAPKHAHLKFCFEEYWVVGFFFALFLWTSLPARPPACEDICRNRMEKKSGTNAAKLNTFTDVKSSAFCRLVNLFLSLGVDLQSLVWQVLKQTSPQVSLQPLVTMTTLVPLSFDTCSFLHSTSYPLQPSVTHAW